MSLILGAQSAVATGFNVDNSCRFDDGDAVQLYRAISVGGNRKVWTISFWFKKGNAVGCRLWAQGNTPSQNPSTMIELGASGAMTIFHYNGSYPLLLEPTAKLTDSNAWYHLCLTFDDTPSTPSSASIKFFINGTQQTAFGTETYPSQDFLTEINNTTYDFYAAAYDGGNYYDGYMAEFCLIDGTAYDASTFGEFDEDSPTIWKPKDFSEDVTFGTNGFYLDFKDSSALGNDVSGNNNDLTATNLAAVDQATDSPTNNFCTMNPLRFTNLSATYSEGNCAFIRTGTGGQMNGTQGITKGKWYYECLIDDYWQYIGWSDGNAASLTAACSDVGSHFYGMYSNASACTSYANGSGTLESAYTAMVAGQYWGVAFDADNGEMYYSVNGTWQDSSDPTARTNPAMTSVPATENMMPAIGQGTGSRSSTIKMNFGGSPAFTVSSGNADGNGYGNFEYAVPSGFYALCTKNIAEFG